MTVKQIFEFRGYTERMSKKNTKLYSLNLEGENGEGHQFYTDNEELAKSLVKGQRYIVSFTFNGFTFLSNITPLKQ